MSNPLPDPQLKILLNISKGNRWDNGLLTSIKLKSMLMALEILGYVTDATGPLTLTEDGRAFLAKQGWPEAVEEFVPKRAKTIALVGGSFDPITRGHEHLIVEAGRLFDELHIVTGVNPSKKYLFDAKERQALVREVVAGLPISVPVHHHFLEDQLLIQLATKLRVTHLLRGIRDITDFAYETQMALVNSRLNPSILTVYLTPPPSLTEVSSSTVKGLVGFTGWEDIVSRYVSPVILEALARKIPPRSARRA